MTALEKLRGQLTAKRAEQKVLLDKAGDATDESPFTDEDGKALDGFTDEVDMLVKRIGQAEAAAKLDAMPDKPEQKHSVDDALNIDGKAIVVESAHEKKMRMRKSPEYKQAFWAGIDRLLGRANALTPNGEKVLSEGTGSAGGFLVPSDLYNGIIENPPVDLVLYPRASRYTTSGDSLKIPVLNQGTNWQGGCTVEWTPEGSLKTATEMAFMLDVIEVFTVAGYTPITKQLIQDAIFNIEAYVGQKLTQTITTDIENKFWVGTGIGEPLGVLTCPGITLVNRAGAGAIAWADIVAMMVALPVQDWGNAIWVASPGAWGAIMAWTDTANRPIMTPDPSGGWAQTLRGRPLLISPNLSALGTEGDLVLCDPSYYGYAVREEIEILSSREAYDAFTKNLTYIRAEMRLGGKPLKPMAFVALTDIVAE